MPRYTAIKVALDPTPKQERLLASNAGGARFCYNACLAMVKESFDSGLKPNISHYSLRKWWNENKESLAPWWSDNSKESYSNSCADLATAFKNFFDSRSGKRKGRKSGFPRFKSKHAKQSFTVTTGAFGVADNVGIKIPKIGRVHCFENVFRRVKGRKVRSMTVSYDGLRWYASLLVEDDIEQKASPKRPAVGIDLGIKNLATLSDGTVFENPKAERKLRRKKRKADKAVSRKVGSCKGERSSNRRRKALEHKRKVDAKARNVRKDAIEKATSFIARHYSTVCIEDLNVSGMVRNHKLAKAVEDCAFREFRAKLEQKCSKRCVEVNVIDRFYPSSKTCSKCGTAKAKLSLSERTFRCESCGFEIDRDLNAAINILVAGSAPETLNGRGAGVRPAYTAADRDETPTWRERPARPGAARSDSRVRTRLN